MSSGHINIHTATDRMHWLVMHALTDCDIYAGACASSRLCSKCCASNLISTAEDILEGSDTTSCILCWTICLTIYTVYTLELINRQWNINIYIHEANATLYSPLQRHSRVQYGALLASLRQHRVRTQTLQIYMQSKCLLYSRHLHCTTCKGR